MRSRKAALEQVSNLVRQGKSPYEAAQTVYAEGVKRGGFPLSVNECFDRAHLEADQVRLW